MYVHLMYIHIDRTKYHSSMAVPARKVYMLNILHKYSCLIKHNF